ncbi:uncharacterized protein CDAR_490041 [Caerostris darwini]|uniref:Uncharacterized protein n=1 Tax=Caerostris darwini TaxID=1538125 RepID=A0AAV4TMZ6_9ARAC|nr:uncharacterized protein CDAR_490041 [Caerostris darwini]
MSLAIFVICSCFLSEILESDADDPLVIIDQQNAEEETRLPNAHSATFVMGFIFLCLFVYGIYRIYKCHCIHKKPPLSDPGNTGDDPSETATKGHEKYIQEHNDYLAIFGPKRQRPSIHVCEFKQSDVPKNSDEINS